MAGKNIYIEKILDNLLSGVDTALNAVKEAMQKMIGGDDPETQKSLPDVVNKLDDVIGEDGKSLSNVVTELQNNSAEIIGTGGKSLTDVVTELSGVVNKLDDVITAISHTAAGVFVKPGTTNSIDISDIIHSSAVATYEFNKKVFFSNAQGVLNFSFTLNGTITASTGNKNTITIIRNSDTENKIIYELPLTHYENERLNFNVPIFQQDTITIAIRLGGRTGDSVNITNAALEFDNGIITQPQEIIHVLE